jgi:arylsulfatase A-like enzyme
MKLSILFCLLSALFLGAAKKPNILFIFTDDHAYQAVGAYNSLLQEHCPTPNIDSLAKDGMLFEKCYVTNSICGPMRAAIQTGKYSHANGFLVNGNKFDALSKPFLNFSVRQGTQQQW